VRIRTRTFAVVDEEPDVELDARQLGDRQSLDALAERRAGDGDRVDPVGLAALAAAAPLTGHQPRRDPDHALATNQQEPPEGAGDVATVLERPHPLDAQAARPLERRGEPAVTDLHDLVAQHLTGFGDDHGDRVRPLVHVRTRARSWLRPFHLAEGGRPADMACLRAVTRSYQVTPGHPRPATSDTAKASQAQRPTA
jgi:hypothetical protein